MLAFSSLISWHSISYPRFPFVDLGRPYALIIQNSPCKVLHNLHKNKIYLFTHIGRQFGEKILGKTGDEKEPCGSCDFCENCPFLKPYKTSCRRHYRKAARYRPCRRNRSGGSRRWGTGCILRGGRCRRCPRCRRP